MGFFVRHRLGIVIGFFTVVVLVPLGYGIYSDMTSEPSALGPTFFGSPVFEGGPGDSVTLAADEWKVGDFIVCRGVGSAKLLGLGSGDEIRITGYRLKYLDDGGVRVSCEEPPTPPG